MDLCAMPCILGLIHGCKDCLYEFDGALYLFDVEGGQFLGCPWLKPSSALAQMHRYRLTTPRVRHSQGPPFPGPGIGVRVRVRGTPGMADPGNGGPWQWRTGIDAHAQSQCTPKVRSRKPLRGSCEP